MKTMMTTVVLVLAMLAPAFAQTTPVPVEKERFSTELTIAGLATMLVGAALMVPMEDPTATSYHLEGLGSYCADTNTYRQSVTVSKGGCDQLPAMVTAGIITMGAGAVMTLIGMHKVAVKPQIGHKAIGATVSVKW